MYIKGRPSGRSFFNGKLLFPPAIREAPNGAGPHERLSLHELQKVKPDVIANNTVRFYYLRSLAVHVLPQPPYLRPQPAPQRAKMFSEGFAPSVRTPHALIFWQEFVRQVGLPRIFCPSGSIARFFANDFVHV